MASRWSRARPARYCRSCWRCRGRRATWWAPRARDWAVAAHDRDLGLGGQYLRDLPDAGGRFLVHHVVRMLEDAKELLPMQVALHPRRVVVDAERQIARVRHVEEEALDVAFRRADIGRRRQD